MPPGSSRLHVVLGHLGVRSPNSDGPACAPCSSSPSQAVPNSEQVVAITGCTSGLGLNLALEFMRLGFRVAGCGRRSEHINELNKAHSAQGSMFYVADASKEADVKAWSEAVLAKFGRVDVLCNNAGLGPGGQLPWQMDGERFGQVLDTNVRGVFYGCKYFIPSMLKDLADNPGRGVIKRVINTSSGVGHSTSPMAADYSASKWGVEAYSKSVAQGFHLLRDHTKDEKERAACSQILCVPLAPGVIETEMNTMKNLPTAAVWCKSAVPFIMSIPISESGSSLTVPGFYGKEYMASWAIPDGLRLPGKWVMPS